MLLLRSRRIPWVGRMLAAKLEASAPVVSTSWVKAVPSAVLVILVMGEVSTARNVRFCRLSVYGVPLALALRTPNVAE